MVRPLLSLVFVVCLALTACSAHARTYRTPITLVLFDGLSIDDLEDPALPNLHHLAVSGQTTLMNTAIAGPRTETSAALTLALGALAPSEPTDDEIYGLDEPVERTTAANVYRRRIDALPDPLPPCMTPGAATLLHLGWAPILRRGLADQFLGSVIARAGGDEFLCVTDGLDAHNGGRRVGLFGVDAKGIVRCGALHPRGGEAGLLDVVRAYQGNVAILVGAKPQETRSVTLLRLDRLLGSLLAGMGNGRRIMLVSPRPPIGQDGTWDRLSVAVIAGDGIAPGLLSSPTTRTPGLIANIDIAPTILSWMSIPVPSTMAGHPVSGRPAGPEPLATLKRMDRQVYVNGRALVPIFLLLGVLAGATLVVGFWLRASDRRTALPAHAALTLMTMPLAMLLSAAVIVPSVPALIGLVLAIMAVGGLVVARASRRNPQRGPLLIAAATVALVLLDTLFGGRLVGFSVFSAYQLQGIRFYGIGNEYMGVVVGFTLLAAFLANLKPWQAAALFAVIAFVVGWPSLGANAGGLIAATACFVTGAWRLAGKKAGVGVFLAGCCVGILAALGMALLDRALAGPAASHMGGALSAAGQRGTGYLWEIIARKIAMNARIVAHPAVITASIAIAAIMVVGSSGKENAWSRLSTRHPRWRSGIVPALWGALAAFAFNDSGIVAALFLAGTFLATGVYLLFASEGLARQAEEGASGTLSTVNP